MKVDNTLEVNTSELEETPVFAMSVEECRAFIDGTLTDKNLEPLLEILDEAQGPVFDGSQKHAFVLLCIRNEKYPEDK